MASCEDNLTMAPGTADSTLPPPPCSKFTSNQAVEAQWNGVSRGLAWFKGKITAVHGDGTYDIDYEDGSKESKVAADCIRVMGGRGGDKQATFCANQAVEAQWKGMSVGLTWYKATIVAVHGNKTYDVLYEDGTNEANVKEASIRLAGADAGGAADNYATIVPTKEAKFSTNQAVEAQWSGVSQGLAWFKGKITAVHGDGTYDVEYEDGSKESKVAADCIRVMGGRGGDKQATFCANQAVEAQWKGMSVGVAWFKGKISKVHGNKTYDVDYEDGSKDVNVKEAAIRAVGTDEGAKQSKFTTNQAVEAQWNGVSVGVAWFKGKISKVHGNKTYDVDYEDGSKESKVAADCIRVMGGRGGDKQATFCANQAVEAQWKGMSVGVAWFKGKISKVHGDKTYDVEYEDGSKEAKVKEAAIRAISKQNNFSTMGELRDSIAPPAMHRGGSDSVIPPESMGCGCIVS